MRTLIETAMARIENDGSNGLPCGPTNPTCLAPHPTGNNRFSNLYFPLPDVNASYDAAVFSATRRFKQGVQIDANYTWSPSFSQSAIFGASNAAAGTVTLGANITASI